MTVDWRGQSYPVPEVEPPQQRGLELCHPVFATQLTAYLAHAQTFTELTLMAGETRRTLERQVYLYAQGRVLNTDKRIRSNTLESRHRFGLACDLYAVHSDRTLEWDDAFWVELFHDAPPRLFGLRDIAPLEYVHVELVEADLMIARANDFGLVQT